MNYRVLDSKIFVSNNLFNPKHTFECGQVFCFKEIEGVYICYPNDKIAVIYENGDEFIIECFEKENVQFFINYFDFNTDYTTIKEKINEKINQSDFLFDKFLIEKALQFGYGIRILKQDILEAIISFIISANNNIKRIKNSLNKLREENGEKIIINYSKLKINKKIIEKIKEINFYSFPKLKILKKLNEKYFSDIGTGYRASYLVDTINKVDDFIGAEVLSLDTSDLRSRLIELKGIGRKVADCILLFGYSRLDVFPVDTWIRKTYLDLNNKNNERSSADKISILLSDLFKDLSGYVQQYLFYYKREQ